MFASTESSQLSFEFPGINSVLEDFHSVDEDHRNVITVLLAKQRVVVDVDLSQNELAFATRSVDRGLRFFAEMTPRPRVNGNFGSALHTDGSTSLLSALLDKLSTYMLKTETLHNKTVWM